MKYRIFTLAVSAIALTGCNHFKTSVHAADGLAMEPLLSRSGLTHQDGTRHSPIRGGASPELGINAERPIGKRSEGDLPCFANLPGCARAATCKQDRLWAHSVGAAPIAGNGRVDSSARHHARQSGHGPAADPGKGRRCVPNGGKDLDTVFGSR